MTERQIDSAIGGGRPYILHLDCVERAQRAWPSDLLASLGAARSSQYRKALKRIEDLPRVPPSCEPGEPLERG